EGKYGPTDLRWCLNDRLGRCQLRLAELLVGLEGPSGRPVDERQRERMRRACDDARGERVAGTNRVGRVLRAPREHLKERLVLHPAVPAKGDRADLLDGGAP